MTRLKKSRISLGYFLKAYSYSVDAPLNNKMDICLHVAQLYTEEKRYDMANVYCKECITACLNSLKHANGKDTAISSNRSMSVNSESLEVCTKDQLYMLEQAYYILGVCMEGTKAYSNAENYFNVAIKINNEFTHNSKMMKQLMIRKKDLNKKMRMIAMIGITFEKNLPLLPRSSNSSKAMVKPYISSQQCENIPAIRRNNSKSINSLNGSSTSRKQANYCKLGIERECNQQVLEAYLRRKKQSESKHKELLLRAGVNHL